MFSFLEVSPEQEINIHNTYFFLLGEDGVLSDDRICEMHYLGNDGFVSVLVCNRTLRLRNPFETVRQTYGRRLDVA